MSIPAWHKSIMSRLDEWDYLGDRNVGNCFAHKCFHVYFYKTFIVRCPCWVLFTTKELPGCFSFWNNFHMQVRNHLGVISHQNALDWTGGISPSYSLSSGIYWRQRPSVHLSHVITQVWKQQISLALREYQNGKLRRLRCELQWYRTTKHSAGKLLLLMRVFASMWDLSSCMWD